MISIIINDMYDYKPLYGGIPCIIYDIIDSSPYKALSRQHNKLHVSRTKADPRSGTG
jgi:hypothetical protein